MNSDKVMLRENIETLQSSPSIYLKVKRVFDLLIGLFGIFLILPLAFIIKAISIYNRDYNSIFFKQQRIGKDGKLFWMYKFRTMVPNADEVLETLLKNNASFREEYMVNKKVKNDPRITKLGKILRKTSLDEMPQFINVFLGQMSLVGNRPYLPREKEDMGIYFNQIVKTKPGITGLWQISGRNNVTFNERVQIESKYSYLQNARTDMKIIKDTIVQVVKKDGAM
ncbi:MAG: hypothetical protein HFJ02_02550 [Bacilli bacterium]|nr:hypothetical protein [Bacilli bacterium]